MFIIEGEITIKSMLTENENRLFWDAKKEYFCSDVIPNAEFGLVMTEAEKEYFLSERHKNGLERLCEREKDRLNKILFEYNDTVIGICLYCTYASEDGKCFILDFCVFSEYRNRGIGSLCFAALKAKVETEGAKYFELNTHCRRSMKFWNSLGFVYNGYDDHGVILLILPPELTEMTCEELNRGDIWQILRLQNGLKAECKEDFLSGEQQEALIDAVKDRAITFFVIKRDTRVIAMCSLHQIFTTFYCAAAGIVGDFFVEPAFRKKGCARNLFCYVQKKCFEDGITSLLISVSDQNLAICQTFGFESSLGISMIWKTLQ